MLTLISQLTSIAHEALPLFAALAGALALLGVHLKNQRLEKAHSQLAEKVADLANANAEKNISNLEVQVQIDDEKRLALESSLGDLYPVPLDRKDGR